eukprot:scaffold42991_cov59-Attheya_sp.AAC.4
MEHAMETYPVSWVMEQITSMTNILLGNTTSSSCHISGESNLCSIVETEANCCLLRPERRRGRSLRRKQTEK